MTKNLVTVRNKIERKQTMNTLKAEFENSNGKIHYLQLKNFDLTKTGEEIKASLTKLTKLNLFEKNGVGLFKKVRHATLIKTTETIIFDDRIDAHAELMDSSLNNTESHVQIEETASVVEEPRQAIREQEEVQMAHDFVVLEEKPEPDVLIQTIELPEQVNPRELTQSDALSIVVSCMPDDYTLENIQIEDNKLPTRLILTERLKKSETQDMEIAQALPDVPKKKRKRLLDLIQKRE